MAALSLGASIVQRSIERRFSLSSNKSPKSSPVDGIDAVQSPEAESIEEDRTPCFDLAEDLEAGFMAEAFMAKDTTSPVQPKKPFRRCCIFHASDSADEYHLLSEAGDQMLTARYLRAAGRIDFFLPEEERKFPQKDDNSENSKRSRPAFVMNYNANRDNWLLRQTDCEHCMQRPKHLTCEALGRGQQVAFVQHALRPVGKARVHYVDIRIPPISSGVESAVWCTVTMGKDLCGRSYSSSSSSMGYSRFKQFSAPEVKSQREGDSPERSQSESESPSSPTRSPSSPTRSRTRSRFDLEIQPLRVHTKVPVWDEELESLVLNFQDRTVQSSPMNFMLRTEDDESIILQHAKMAANTFGLDYRYPLSTIQAFAVALTALSWD
jgi:hypothetical protein